MILQLKRNPDAVLEEFFKNVHFPHRQSRQAQQLKRDDDENLVGGLKYLLTSDVRDLIPKIKIPVLLLHGAEDRIIPPTAAEWLNDHLPESELKVFPNQGHALAAHAFNPVMNSIQAFLTD